jgi:GNAT superfamily N-acetyltransferase
LSGREAAREDVGMPVNVRKATTADAVALAGLRWRWLVQERGHPATDHAAFLELFSAWVIEHLSTHVPFLAEVDDRVVAMAWLMVADRVPSPAHRRRRFGDIQSVYVVPELRDGGVGGQLLDAVLTEARSLGLEHVTVHSSDRAVSFYRRSGFRNEQRRLQWGPT